MLYIPLMTGVNLCLALPHDNFMKESVKEITATNVLQFCWQKDKNNFAVDVYLLSFLYKYRRSKLYRIGQNQSLPTVTDQPHIHG